MTHDFIHESQQRGFIHQATDLEGLQQKLAAGPITGYIGFDATAPSLHVGNLVSLMWLRLLERTGHNVIALLGGATTEVGDPSFRATDRPFLETETISGYMQSISPVVRQLIPGATMLDNASWLKSINYMAFLRDYGRHFSINRMLSFDSVQLRLERDQSLSFLEFNYMILQAYDFVHLSREHGCILQMGGSDQWGNIINGVELARRLGLPTLYGITSPLITTAQGAKMGKTAQGAVWLNADMCPPFDYWQFWRNTHDADVGKFLRLFTDMPIDEIQRLEALKDAEINEAKVILANEATALMHGAEKLPAIHEAVANVFNNSAGGLGGLPQHTLNAAQCPISLEALFVQCGLTASKGATRRLVEGKGARLNDEIITDCSRVLNVEDFPVKVSVGKKQHIQVCVDEASHA